MADKDNKDIKNKSTVLSLLHKFFGIRFGESLPQIVNIQSASPQQFSPMGSGGYFSDFEDERITRYREYDVMDNDSSDITIALDIYAEEATQTSTESGKAVWVTSEDEEVAHMIEQFLSDIDLEERVYGLARHIAKYGDLFLFPIIDNELDEESSQLLNEEDKPSNNLRKFKKKSDSEDSDVEPDDEDDEDEGEDDEEGLFGKNRLGVDSDETGEDIELGFETDDQPSYTPDPNILSGHTIRDFWIVHPSTVSISTNPKNGKIIGFNSTSIGMETLIGDEAGRIPPQSMTDKDEEGFSPWDFVHFKIIGSDLTSKYGTSMVESVRRSWRTLQMLEVSVALWRLNRAGSRLLYKIDVGQSSPDEAQEIVNNWIKTIRGEVFLNVTDPSSENGRNTGDLAEYLDRYKPFSQFHDIYWPVAEGSDSSVDVLTMNADLAHVEDIEHFKNKVRTALGIPKAYFDQDISGWNANKALAQQDIRFSKKIERLQRTLIKGIETLCSVFLLYKGKNEFSFTINMEPPSSLSQLQRLEVLQQKVSVAIELVGAADTFGFDRDLWSVWVLKNIVGMSEDDIKKFKTKPAEPEPLSPDNIGDIPQIDMSQPDGGDNEPPDKKKGKADILPIGGPGQDKGFKKNQMLDHLSDSRISRFSPRSKPTVLKKSFERVVEKSIEREGRDGE